MAPYSGRRRAGSRPLEPELAFPGRGAIQYRHPHQPEALRPFFRRMMKPADSGLGHAHPKAGTRKFQSFNGCLSQTWLD